MTLPATIFVESDAQAAWVASHASGQRREAVVALTAEAVEALESLAVPHVPVAEVSDLRPLAGALYGLNVRLSQIAREIETFIVGRYPPARGDGPGFLEGQTYGLQHDVITVAARSLAITDAIRRLRPSSIALFAGPAAAPFSGDGYVDPPWAPVLRSACPAVPIELLDAVPPLNVSHEGRPFFARVRNRASLTMERLARRRVRLTPRADSGLDGMRLLLADGPTYDWAPVAAELLRRGNTSLFALSKRSLSHSHWGAIYNPVIRALGESGVRPLGVEPYARVPHDETVLAGLFDEWVRESRGDVRLEVLGMDMLPGLLPHLRHVVTRGPALRCHTDAVATAALDCAKPEAVCFFSMPSLASQRVAFAARKRGIVVLAYQHGATYGTHAQVMQSLLEQAHADYFLTYGDGTRVLDYPEFRARARFVSVGSTRIDAMRPRRTAHVADRLRLLWISEFATANLWGAAHSLEDTRRYAVQREGLRRLTAHGSLDITYRPHRHQWRESGAARWLRRARLPVNIDVVAPLERLISRSDIVVTDGSSGQVWFEALAIGVPVVAFCDPVQTRLTPEFERDLDGACIWCRDEESFLAMLGRLAADPAAFARDLKQIDTTPFLEKYVLGAGMERPLDRVLTFLGELRRRPESLPLAAQHAAR